MNDLPFEFTFAGANGKLDMAQVPVLGKLVDEWCTATYGEEMMVNGILAFDDQKNLVGVRAEAYGPLDDSVESTVVNAGENAWDLMVEWLRGLGVNNIFSFIRRCAEYGHGAEVGQWDHDITETTNALSIQTGVIFQGHLITNGQEHRIISAHHNHQYTGIKAGVEGLLDMVDGPTQAAIGQAALDQMVAMDPDTDPEVIAVVQMAIDRTIRNDHTPPTPEQAEMVGRALAKLQARLDQVMSGEVELHDPVVPPPSNETRPDVPPAFYH